MHLRSFVSNIVRLNLFVSCLRCFSSCTWVHWIVENSSICLDFINNFPDLWNAFAHHGSQHHVQDPDWEVSLQVHVAEISDLQVLTLLSQHLSFEHFNSHQPWCFWIF